MPRAFIHLHKYKISANQLSNLFKINELQILMSSLSILR